VFLEDEAGYPASESAFIDALMNLPPDERAKQALALSARLVEFAAFETAGQLPSKRIGDLIDCSASLDRISDDLSSSLTRFASLRSLRVQ
jgi:hypothetical protein